MIIYVYIVYIVVLNIVNIYIVLDITNAVYISILV
jgi:hypothetical protein